MLSAAWWTCALLALASARVYRQCELARELLTLGIRREQVSTWVCIAYHESRLDTAAYNHGSGDHGLLQISEIYWCGKGKACGVSCLSLRDEDIANDVQCALKIYKEHRHLQGDGFMAWVVYPLYCMNDTLNYIAGCDDMINNVTSKVGKSFNFNDKAERREEETNFLKVNSFLRGSYGNELSDEFNYNNAVSKDWSNVVIENIDELSLPSDNQEHKPVLMTVKDSKLPTITTTQTPPNYLSIVSLYQKSLSDFEDITDIKVKQHSPNVVLTEVDKIILSDISKTNTSVYSKSSTTSLPTNTISIDITPPPAFFAISTLIHKNLGDDLNNYNEDDVYKWLNFKVDNIDELSLINQNVTGTIEFSKNKNQLGTKPHSEEKEPINSFTMSHVDSPIVPNNSTIKNTSLKIADFSDIESKVSLPTYLNVASFVQQHDDIDDDKEFRTQGKENNKVNVEKTSFVKVPDEITLVTSNINQPSFLKVASDFQQKQQSINNNRHKSSRKHWQNLVNSTEALFTTTESSSVAPLPVKPSRIIESNQFRHKTTTSTTALETDSTIETIPISTEKQVFMPVKPSRILETKDFRQKTKTPETYQLETSTVSSTIARINAFTTSTPYRFNSDKKISIRTTTESSVSLVTNKWQSTSNQFRYTTPKITTLIDVPSPNAVNTSTPYNTYSTTKKIPDWYTFTSRTLKPSTSKLGQEIDSTTRRPSGSITVFNIQNKTESTTTPKAWSLRFSRLPNKQQVTGSPSTENKIATSTKRPWRTTEPWKSKLNFTIKPETEKRYNISIDDHSLLSVNITDRNKKVSSLPWNYRQTRLWQSTTPVTVTKFVTSPTSLPIKTLSSTTRVPWYTFTSRTSSTKNVPEIRGDKIALIESTVTAKPSSRMPWSWQTISSTLTTTPKPIYSTTKSPTTRSWYTFTSRTASTAKFISTVNASVDSTTEATTIKAWTPWSWRTTKLPKNQTPL